LNNDPDANDDVATTQINTPVSGNALDNDTDLNGDTLVVNAIDGTPVLGAGGVTVATASGGSVAILADGSFVYTPGTDFTGTETLEYTISDGNGGSDTATLYLSVFDQVPQPEDDINLTQINSPVDGNVLVNDSSDPGDDLVIGNGSGAPITGPTVMLTAQGGQLIISPDGSYTYTPPTDFVGEDTITLEVCDEGGNCANSELVIDVVDSTASPLNTPPVAGDDSFEVFTDQMISSTLTGNDGDPDGDVIEVLTAGGAAPGAPFTTANGGTVIVNPDGTFDYTPAAGFIGVDTFDYAIVDPSGATDDATVTLTVQPDPDPAANDAPDANDDSVITQLNTSFFGSVLTNDTDPNPADVLTVTSKVLSTPLATAMVVLIPQQYT